jgi:DNA-3-methyladenine glycosylase II
MSWLDPDNDTPQAHLDREVRRACRALRRRDPVLGALIKKHGVQRINAERNYFHLMVATIISQQLSTKAANTIYRRLVENLGGRRPRPKDILEAGDAQLTGAGLSRSKAKYLRNIAEAFSTRRMGPKTFAALSDEEAIERITAIKGIGEWSAHMFLMFGLGRLDVFPVGDQGLRNAMTMQYGLRRPPSDKRLHAIADVWRPYRTVASMYLWKSYD